MDYQIIQQEVPLQAIVKLGKEVELIFEIEANAVIMHCTYSDKAIKEETTSDRFFYLYITNEKQTEELGLDLQKAFDKAGYFLYKEVWFRNQ